MPVTETNLLFFNHTLNFDILDVKVGAVVVVVVVVDVVGTVVVVVVAVVGTVPMLVRTLYMRVVTSVVPKISRME